MSQEKEWSENPEDDPVELQKRQLELGKKFLEKMEAEEAKNKAREEEYRAAGPMVAPAYTPPTFEEVSAALKKAWGEVEKIMPTAGDVAKAYAFQTLTHVAAQRLGSFIG